MPASFATQLRTARERAGLSQSALAEQIGVTRNWISAIEAGQKVPTLARVEQLHKAIASHHYRDGITLAQAGDDFTDYVQLAHAAYHARVAQWRRHVNAKAAKLREHVPQSA